MPNEASDLYEIFHMQIVRGTNFTVTHGSFLGVTKSNLKATKVRINSTQKINNLTTHMTRCSLLSAPTHSEE